jgi:hypothetical protein
MCSILGAVQWIEKTKENKTKDNQIKGKGVACISTPTSTKGRRMETVGAHGAKGLSISSSQGRRESKIGANVGKKGGTDMNGFGQRLVIQEGENVVEGVGR